MTTNEPGWVAKSAGAVLRLFRGGTRFYCGICGREQPWEGWVCCEQVYMTNWKDGTGKVVRQSPVRSSSVYGGK